MISTFNKYQSSAYTATGASVGGIVGLIGGPVGSLTGMIAGGSVGLVISTLKYSDRAVSKMGTMVDTTSTALTTSLNVGVNAASTSVVTGVNAASASVVLAAGRVSEVIDRVGNETVQTIRDTGRSVAMTMKFAALIAGSLSVLGCSHYFCAYQLMSDSQRVTCDATSLLFISIAIATGMMAIRICVS